MGVQGVFLGSVAYLPQWLLMRIAQSRSVIPALLLFASGLGFVGYRMAQEANGSSLSINKLWLESGPSGTLFVWAKRRHRFRSGH